MTETLTDKITEYIAQRKATKLEPLQKELNRILDKNDNEVDIASAKVEYQQNAAPIEAAYTPTTWLTNAAKRAKQISLATHSAKFTHSDAKSSSILVNDFVDDENGYLTTAKLLTKTLDATGNAAALDVAKLLKLNANGCTLAQQLQADDTSTLAAFTHNAELLDEWLQGFKQALSDAKLSSHTLAKQLYFPVDNQASNNSSYHMLCLLFSSSLAHELHRKITSTRFGDTAKEIRDARKSGKFHKNMEVNYPATAVQNFGGSKPQNISQLNSERYGQVYLLNSAPPSWQSHVKPPTNKTTLFDREFNARVGRHIYGFISFIKNLRPDQHNFKTRYKRDHHFVAPIIDELLNRAALYQSMEESAGWSTDKECKLKWAYCLWLDIHRDDDSFQTEREKNQWQAVIVKDFGLWLNRQLNKDKQNTYVLGDIENTYWQKLLSQRLQRFEWASHSHESTQGDNP